VELVLASSNAHQLRELSALLGPHDVVRMPDGVRLPPETGRTFADNALAKARAAAKATGRPALGEDSGIEVRALAGAPGILSARYAGDSATDADNLEKLLDEMRERRDRRAAYACALALVTPDGAEKVFQAQCWGRLARAPRGTGGFGYDPIFEPDEAKVRGVTMAELAPDEKNAISHRGRAAGQLLEWLAQGR
jgi:XTP/dITP diphosphohydrolase